MRNWHSEFGLDYQPPQEILDAVAARQLADISWRNDAAPCFELAGQHGDGARLWVDAAEPAHREMDGPRFLVVIGDDTGSNTVLYDGDDVTAALAALHSTRKA